MNSADLDSRAVRQRRAILETWLSAEERNRVCHRSTGRAMAILAVVTLSYGTLATVALLPIPIPLNLIMTVPVGLAISVLFVLGHDACHQAFTPSRRLNDWIARLAFMPSCHANSLWDVDHNRLHHHFTNLIGHDHVWAPMSPAEYRAASPARRALYRLYRGPWGAGPYYFIEMWAKRLILPTAPATRGDWRRHLPDSLFAILGTLLLILAVAAIGHGLAPGRPLWLTVVIGWLLPFLVFNAVIGWTIHVHHTHPRAGWYADVSDWSPYRALILSTIQSRYFQPLDLFSNNIMEHNAHHILSTIPCYNLRGAQATLRARFPGIIREALTPVTYLRNVRACKLFDFERRCWTDFDGRPTGPALPLEPDPDLTP
jgi:omega-6 fatty acid desaturase (delta-12 desaturase)